MNNIMKIIQEDVYNQMNKISSNGFEPKYVIMNNNEYRMYMISCSEYFHYTPNTILGLPIILSRNQDNTLVVTDAKFESMYNPRY